jgi:hypothetical protein
VPWPVRAHDRKRELIANPSAVNPLLVDLDVHPRVVMQVFRRGQFPITMEIHTKVSSTATRDALKRLGDSLDRR